MTRVRVRVNAAEEYSLLLRHGVRLTVKASRLPHPSVVDVFLLSDDDMRAVNKERRGVDAVTDVLSFPFWNEGERVIPDPGTGRVFLGDILIASERARVQAREYNHSEARELCYLAVHGALHLLGYDHETEWDRAVMRQREEAVMEKMGLRR